jgi:CRP/FNR family transcriptional regulator, anaerobic regulatory protein
MNEKTEVSRGGSHTNEKSRRHRRLRSEASSSEGPSLRVIPFGENGEEAVHLSRRQRLQLAGIATKLHLPARMILYREESAAEWVFIVSHGVVKTFRDLSSGRRRGLAFLFADDVFGLAESGHYVNTAQSVTPVRLYRIRVEALTDLLLHDSALHLFFLCKLADELRRSLRQTIIVSRRDAIGRMAMFLHMLEQRSHQDGHRSGIEIPMTRSDTANYLGLSVETVSRASRELERHRIVTFAGVHAAKVVDRYQFEKLAVAA